MAMQTRDRLGGLAAGIAAALDLKELLLAARGAVAEAAAVEDARILSVDPLKGDLFTLLRDTSGAVSEVRVGLDTRSLAGLAALQGGVLRFADVQDLSLLKRLGASLRFDPRLDRATGTRTRGLLCCPILFERQTVGLLQLVNRRDGKTFDANDEDLARQLSALLAQAIHDRRRAPGPPESSPHLWRRLVGLGRRLHAVQGLPVIVVEASAGVADLLGAARAEVYAFDARQRDLLTYRRRGDALEERRVAVSAGSLPGLVVRLRRSVLVRDLSDAAELARLGLKPEPGVEPLAALARPILFEGGLLGALVALRKSGPFGAQEEETASEVAAVVGVALFDQRRLARGENPQRFGLAVDRGLLTEKDLEAALAMADKTGRDVAGILMEYHKVPRETLGEALSQHYGCSFWELQRRSMPPELKGRLSPELLRKKNAWAPVEERDGTLIVAIEDPHDEARLREITGRNLAERHAFVVALRSDLLAYIERSYGTAAPGAEEQQLGQIVKELGSGRERGKSEPAGRVEDASSPIARLVNQIIETAWRKGASDVHVEPYGGDDSTQVRLRVEGDCKEYLEVPGVHRDALVQRIKIMADLRIDERRRPQDGKIRYLGTMGQIELRVATIPTAGGNEDVVMRILAASKPLPLDQMGFSARNLSEFKQILGKPYGLCLVVGPTGSGKTTTLHSALGHVNTADMKIWTAEDPVEITQRRLRQVQVNPRMDPPFTFADALKAFLRADPDVIMVGEMRDPETAGAAIEASLTGHLVLSTLHTNSAPETITRLLDLGLDPFSFADALLGVLAQRLVRTLCRECREPYAPSAAEFAELMQEYGVEWWDRLGVRYAPELRLHRPRGCPRCDNGGYRGRAGIHELLVATDGIKQLIQRREPIAALRAQAMRDGMTTLLQDGIAKVVLGLTDLKQVQAVCMR